MAGGCFLHGLAGERRFAGLAALRPSAGKTRRAVVVDNDQNPAARVGQPSPYLTHGLFLCGSGGPGVPGEAGSSAFGLRRPSAGSQTVVQVRGRLAEKTGTGRRTHPGPGRRGQGGQELAEGNRAPPVGQRAGVGQWPAPGDVVHGAAAGGVGHGQPYAVGVEAEGFGQVVQRRLDTPGPGQGGGRGAVGAGDEPAVGPGGEQRDGAHATAVASAPYAAMAWSCRAENAAGLASYPAVATSRPLPSRSGGSGRSPPALIA